MIFCQNQDLQDFGLNYDVLNIDLMINYESARVKIELPKNRKSQNI